MANDNKGVVDYAQTLKNSYDVTVEALRVMPVASEGFAIELSESDGDSVATRPLSIDTTSLFTTQTAVADVNSSNVDILNYKGYFVSFTWTGLNAADSVLKLQASVDGTTFHDVPSATTTLVAASGSGFYHVTDAYYHYFRLNYAHGTNTAGSITAKYTVKG